MSSFLSVAISFSHFILFTFLFCLLFCCCSDDVQKITPDDIYKFFCHKIYGTEDPSNTDQPRVRSTTIAYMKKSISYFMNSTGKWNESENRGNPTQSKKVNNIIKAMKKSETRGTGADSKADRAFTMEEFTAIVELLDKRHRAMACMQLHLISRGDDTSHMKKSVLKQSLQFQEYLTARISWSKNVNDTTDCPDHILLPSKDPRTCVYLSLSIWLEEWCGKGIGHRSQWLFVDGETTSASPVKQQDNEANLGKNKYLAAVKKCIEHHAFRPSTQGNLGSHSIRKLGTTHCRRCGAPKDDVDYRARWQSKGRMQDRYTDVQLPWPDLNAAAKLCLGGPIKYKIKQQAGITNEWICSVVTPAITEIFDEHIGAILGRALLWACFDAEWSEKVCPEIRHRVVNEFIQLERFNTDNTNPVDKIEVVPYEGVLHEKFEFIATQVYSMTRSYYMHLNSSLQKLFSH